ncbi:hypothetical protein SKAU_G00195390 [Synaphobranchus kaupii]|uniref:Uncharacterized protein n=1 Tax=Synaphobranchus kaupii TaxID=118154 RepID=A0A9Q1FEE8_SYNKA|nr:hypothetical protein SKAU_G00195390 [Synaphobranchus kaupii]
MLRAVRRALTEQTDRPQLQWVVTQTHGDSSFPEPSLSHPAPRRTSWPHALEPHYRVSSLFSAAYQLKPRLKRGQKGHMPDTYRREYGRRPQLLRKLRCSRARSGQFAVHAKSAL